MNKFRYDGTFVIPVNGLPYHVIECDKLYALTVADFNANPQNYEAEETETMKYQDNEWIDISQTSEYLNKIRLAEIEQELLQADVDYETILNTPIEYTNGHTYKPVFINDYVLLIASGLTYEIWSDDEIYYEQMDTAEISQLALFLKSIAEPKYQERKIKRKALLEEKATLLG